MIINSHDLLHTNDAGNGFHGRCKHCGLALVTDLGYCSWDGTKCVDREIVDEKDMPAEIKSYARFRGYRWDHVRKIFTKASFNQENDELTLDQLHEIVFKLQEKYQMAE